MKKILFVLYCTLFVISGSAQDTLQRIVPGRFNSPEQQKKPYVILISVDGMGAEIFRKNQPENILRLTQKGVKADYMLSSFPSLTFPNHYTIVTGLYPSHHGLVNNTFYAEEKHGWYSMGNKKRVADGSWYGGTPLWVLAEQNKMLSASFYWVASEADVKGIRPTYYYEYSEKISIKDRISAVVNWLQLPAEKRPHLITFYFPQVDHAAHDFGPNSKEATDALKQVDKNIAKLVAAVDSLHLPVNYILVSDHGMAELKKEKVITKLDGVDTAQYYSSNGSALVQMYVKDKANIQSIYQQLKKNKGAYQVYLTGNTPARWHFNKNEDSLNRIGDILLVAEPPTYFYLGKGDSGKKGAHGFDPKLKSMHASFFAWGPAFKNLRIPPFENIHVFPLITEILQLPYQFKIDGKKQVLQKVLK